MFVNILGFSILIPVLPFVVRENGMGEITFGLLLSSYFVFQMVGSPLLGTLSDQYGRKPILLISQFGTLMSWVIFGIAYFVQVGFEQPIMLLGIPLPIWIIGLSRITDGITGGNFSVAFAYLSDVVSPEKKTTAFGYLGAVIGFGMIVGPALGSFSNATSISYLGTVIVAFLISLVTLIAMQLYLKESLPPASRRQSFETRLLNEINFFRKIKRFRENPLVLRVLMIRVFFSVTMSSYTSIIVFHLIDRFGLDEAQVGIFLLFVGSFMIFNQLVVVPRVSRRFGDIRMLVFGMSFLMFGLFVLNQPFTILAFVIVYYFINLGLSLGMPAIKGILSHNVARNMQGEIMGVDEGLVALASAIGPAFGALLYHMLEAEAFPMIGFVMMIPFCIATISILRTGKPYLSENPRV